MTEEQIIAALRNLDEIMTGTGAHASHTQKQIGRYVHCSCGTRTQGRLPQRSKGNHDT